MAAYVRLSVQLHGLDDDPESIAYLVRQGIMEAIEPEYPEDLEIEIEEWA